MVQLSPKGADAPGDIAVLVLGTAFRDFGDAKCKFGSAEVPARVHHTGAITCTAPHSKDAMIVPPYYPFQMPVMISLNGVNFKGSHLATFWYYNLSRVLVAAVRPSGGPPSGGTLVNVSGTLFTDYGGAVQGPKCRFGSVVVPATLLSITQAQCIAPPQPQGAPESVPVSISLNGYTDERGLAGGQLYFRYRVEHTVSALHPLGGPARGLSVVTVSGTGFVDTSGVRTQNCSVDDHLLCKLYGDAIGYSPHLVLGRSDPNNADPGLSCLFGEPAFAVPASITSDTEILCPTPPLKALQGLRTPGPWCAAHGQPHCTDPAYAEHGVLAVPVRVTLNGNRSDTSGFVPWFVLPEGLPRAFHATPWGGPADGGTNVTIVGEALLDLGTPLCRFGHIDVPAVMGGFVAHSSELTPLVTEKLVFNDRSLQEVARQVGRKMTCISPAGHEYGRRSVNLHVSLDGENFVAVGGGFTYFDRIEVSSVFPRGGPLSGGYKITVHGTEFPRLGGLLCDFGGQSVPASVASLGQLLCDVPSVQTARTVPLRITLNGDVGDALSNASRPFAYFDEQLVRVSSVEPSVGVWLGDTRVTVRGNGFAVHGTPKCRFGDHAPVDVASVKLNATDEDVVEGFVCHAPPHGQLTGFTGHEDVLVEVSLTGYADQYSSGSDVTFQYQALCYARDTWAYYDTHPGAALRIMDFLIRLHPPLRKYDVDGNRAVNQTEYQAMRDAHDAEPDQFLQLALQQYARETCFAPGDLPPGKEMAADRDAMGVPIDSEDQTRGLLWYSGGTMYSSDED